MSVRVLLLIGFILEVMAETGLGFRKVIFTGFSLKNFLLLVLLLAVFMAGRSGSRSGAHQRLSCTRAIHRNYIIYISLVIVATAAAYSLFHIENYDIVQVTMAIKSSIIDPYLVFLVYLLYPRNKNEFQKLLTISFFIIAFTAGLTVVASVVSPGLFFGVDNDAARPNGPFGEPNQTAAVLAMVLVPLAARLIGQGGFSSLRLAAVAALFAGILVTGSRGGLLAVVIGLGYFLFSIRQRIQVGKKVAIGLSILIGVILTWLILPDQSRDLIISRFAIFDSSHIDWKEASSGRTYLWGAAFGKWLDSPMFGYGWMGFTTMFGSPTHNSYLEVLVSAGPLALLFYILIFINLFGLLGRVSRLESGEDNIVATGFLGGAVALAIALLFVNLYTPWLVVWALIGMMAGYCCCILDDDTPRVEKGSSSRRLERAREVRILSRVKK